MIIVLSLTVAKALSEPFPAHNPGRGRAAFLRLPGAWSIFDWMEMAVELVSDTNSKHPARALGTRHEQDAIVWVGSDAVPVLVLLR